MSSGLEHGAEDPSPDSRCYWLSEDLLANSHDQAVNSIPDVGMTWGRWRKQAHLFWNRRSELLEQDDSDRLDDPEPLDWLCSQSLRRASDLRWSVEIMVCCRSSKDLLPEILQALPEDWTSLMLFHSPKLVPRRRSYLFRLTGRHGVDAQTVAQKVLRLDGIDSVAYYSKGQGGLFVSATYRREYATRSDPGAADRPSSAPQ